MYDDDENKLSCFSLGRASYIKYMVRTDKQVKLKMKFIIHCVNKINSPLNVALAFSIVKFGFEPYFYLSSSRELIKIINFFVKIIKWFFFIAYG